MTRSEQEKIAAAIRRAEDGTTGRIAVRIVPDAATDAFARAKREFARVGLHQHGHSNAALVLVAPKARAFAVIGGPALHERVGDGFWQQIITESQPYFAQGATTQGIVHAVGLVGEALKAHFAQPAGPQA